MENRKLFERAKTVFKQMSGMRAPHPETNSFGEEREEKKIEIPEEFLCPISQEIMRDPVKTSDGLSYERKSITEWLESHDTSPLTNEVLSSKNLEPSVELKKIIQQFEENQRIFNSKIPPQKQALLKACIISHSQIQLSLSQTQERLMQAREELKRFHETNIQLQEEIKQYQLLAEKSKQDVKETQAIVQKQKIELSENHSTLQQMNNELKEKNILLQEAEAKEVNCKIVLIESLTKVRERLKTTNDARKKWEKLFYQSQTELETVKNMLASLQGRKRQPQDRSVSRGPFFSNPPLISEAKHSNKSFVVSAAGITLPVAVPDVRVEIPHSEGREGRAEVQRRCC